MSLIHVYSHSHLLTMGPFSNTLFLFFPFHVALQILILSYLILSPLVSVPAPLATRMHPPSSGHLPHNTHQRPAILFALSVFAVALSSA